MFSDAIDREAAWLSTSGDGLPALTKDQGGPFQILQARFPRTLSSNKTGLYVLRSPSSSYKLDRFAALRSMGTTEFMLKLLWPMTNGQGSAESEQVNFEQAIDLVVARVDGFQSDKTHGGRFLSVAEGRGGIVVNYDDVEQGMQSRLFRASIVYSADDAEILS